MRLGSRARRAVAALLGAGFLLTVTTAPAAPGGTTSTGSAAVRTPDVSVTAKASVPARVLLRPGGSTVPVDVTFSTSGRALAVGPGGSVTVGSHVDQMSRTSAALTHLRGNSYRAQVELAGTSEGATWDVLLDANVRATFGPGSAAYDEVELDGAKVASFRVTRPSKVTLRGYRVLGRTVLQGDAGVKVGTYSGGTASKMLPGAKVRLYLDPAGSARRRLVTTVTVGADGTYRTADDQGRTGTWTARLVATDEYPTATAKRKVTVR